MGRILTQKLFIPLSHFRRRRGASSRPVFEAYRQGLQFRREAANWSEEEKEAWSLKALRRATRRAAEETAYYGELFEKIGFDARADFSFEDFSRLPVLERDDILRAPEKLLAKNIPRQQLVKDATGGSTGQPAEIWLGAEERGWKESGIDHSFEKIGVPAGARTAYFWGHHLDPKATDGIRQRLSAFAANVRYFDCFRLSPEIFRRYHAEFEKWSPDCIVAYSSALGQFAEFLRETGVEPKNYPRICFVTGAEKLHPDHRTAIEEVFGKPVHERYGGRDFGGVGIQTKPGESPEYEIDWAWALVEPETEAENSAILVTKFHADAMPLLRYRVGDVGRFPAGSQPGFPAFSLREIIGREVDRIWLPDGKWISGAQLPHLLKDAAVREFMFVQEEDHSVELRIVPKSDFGEAERLRILQAIQANLENVKIELKLVESIARAPAGKWRPVVSKVKSKK